MAKKQKKKSTHNSIPIRPLTDIEKSYLEELHIYEQILKVTIAISKKQHGIKADGRGMRAMKIFTRQTLTAISLRQILAVPSITKHPDAEIWDIASVASLSRNLMEGFTQLHFYGFETVSKEEAELRSLMANLHRNITWKYIHKMTNPDDPILDEFENGITEEIEIIKKHPIASSFSKHIQKRILENNDLYKSKSDFENELEVCINLRRDHRHLSNLAHVFSFSFDRIDNEKGRGIGSDKEINYSMICLMIARKYLAASTVGIADLFHDSIGLKFANQIERIRPLILSGFE